MSAKDFHHPFVPYSIQQQFMEALYDCIDAGSVGIFESPTGTGKSLSLLCGALTWLREHKRKAFDEAIAKIEIDDDEPEWMLNHAREERRQQIHDMRAQLEARLTTIREAEKRKREQLAMSDANPKRRKEAHRVDAAKDDEEQFILDDYESDKEDSRQQSQYSTETLKMLEKLGMLPLESGKGADEEVVEETKIYFCSRTHSQLSQLTGELQRIKLPPGLPPEDKDDTILVEELKHLTLGSRKNLCINQKVAKLPTQTAVNERCIELQQSKTSVTQKCSYLPRKENEDVVLDFRDHALAKIRDIEDLANLGQRLQICPYYASRPAISAAEIVTLPYPLLLQKSAREALGISLRGHVVIIDEAHNLLSAVEGIYSAQVTDIQMKRVKEALIVYLKKFRNRLKGSNRVYVAQLVRLLDSLINFTQNVQKNTLGSTIAPSALLSGQGVDQINLAKLVRYINDSKLARKVESYAAHLAQEAQKTESHSKVCSNSSTDVPTLMHVQNFLMTLMNPSKEGAFLWSMENKVVTLQYLLLNPAEHFRDIVEEARAVILAGGTMSPMDEYNQQLFPYLTDKVQTFSCGHLIPPSSLLVRTIGIDDEGRVEFTFKTRNRANFARAGRAIEKVAQEVQGGLVIFFPSYGLLEDVVRTWKEEPIMARLQKSKRVFLDSRDIAAEETFRAYSDEVCNSGTAILLSVIGGKLSEGINFSDELGRCVVVIGLPYPNLQTPDWQAKLNYLEARAASDGQPRGQSSREHAENVCMRSVNQAIGRVIRHKNDWASILLFDARYGDARIQAKLPGWIRAATTTTTASSNVTDVANALSSFFDARQRLMESA
jgi:chromosome transmission fidelity protein 1